MMDIGAQLHLEPNFASRYPMQPRPDPRCWIIIAHLKHAARRLDLGTRRTTALETRRPASVSRI
jgi:hypothetical protein